VNLGWFLYSARDPQSSVYSPNITSYQASHIPRTIILGSSTHLTLSRVPSLYLTQIWENKNTGIAICRTSQFPPHLAAVKEWMGSRVTYHDLRLAQRQLTRQWLLQLSGLLFLQLLLDDVGPRPRRRLVVVDVDDLAQHLLVGLLVAVATLFSLSLTVRPN